MLFLDMTVFAWLSHVLPVLQFAFAFKIHEISVGFKNAFRLFGIAKSTSELNPRGTA